MAARYRKKREERDFCRLAVAMGRGLLGLAEKYKLDDPWEAISALEEAARQEKPSLYKAVRTALDNPRHKEWLYAEARERYVEEARHFQDGLAPIPQDSIFLDQLEEKKLISQSERLLLEGSVLCGFSLKEIARILGVPYNEVKWRWWCLCQELGGALKENEE